VRPATLSGREVAAPRAVMLTDEVLLARMTSGRVIRSSEPKSSFQVKILDDGLDHQVTIAQVFQVRGARNARQYGVSVLLRHFASFQCPTHGTRDSFVPRCQRLVVDLSHDHLEAGLRCLFDNAGAHQACAYHADGL
jgi:hypothetical protein